MRGTTASGKKRWQWLPASAKLPAFAEAACDLLFGSENLNDRACFGAGMIRNRHPARSGCFHAAKGHARLSASISPPTLARSFFHS